MLVLVVFTPFIFLFSFIRNVLIQGNQPKIADFGISKKVNGKQTNTKEPMTTLPYKSPQQFNDVPGDYSFDADNW